MNIVQALNKVKTDLLNFATENLQLKANTDHTHTDILNLVTENLQLKADADHTHEDILNLVKELKANKANTDHTHDLSDLFAADKTVLSSYQYGNKLPKAGTAGRIFFKKVDS